MKIKKIIIGIIYLGSALSLMTSCEDSSGSYVYRSDDHVDLSYATTSGTFTVCTNGKWKISTSATWFSVDPQEGTGDGTTRQVVTVTPQQNTAAARTDKLTLSAAGRELEFSINQAEGYAQVGTPSIVGSLLQNNTSTAYISVPYAKAMSGQSYTGKVTMSGAGSAGLSVPDVVYTSSVTGTIKIPITGTPTTLGDVTFTISSGLPSVSDVTAVATVTDGVIVNQDFSKFVYGGDDALFVAGTILPQIGSTGSKDFDYSKSPTTATPQTDGSSQIFATMGDTYRASRGMTGWSGSQNFERPGYMKIGVTASGGYLTTPALSGLTGLGTRNLLVTMKVMAWDQNSILTPITFSLTGNGTCSITEYDISARTASTAGTWEDVTLTITGADSATKFTVSSTSTSGVTRFLLDDLKIKITN